jgi:hypothetical protein
MTEPDHDPDFVASARRLAAELLPMLQGLAEAAYNPRWAEQGTTQACYGMLLSAALHQLATLEVAREAHRRPDVQTMFLGIRTYGMMWHCLIDMGAVTEELRAEGEIIH